jgi:hypothetical protein
LGLWTLGHLVCDNTPAQKLLVLPIQRAARVTGERVS